MKEALLKLAGALSRATIRKNYSQLNDEDHRQLQLWISDRDREGEAFEQLEVEQLTEAFSQLDKEDGNVT